MMKHEPLTDEQWAAIDDAILQSSSMHQAKKLVKGPDQAFRTSMIYLVVTGQRESKALSKDRATIRINHIIRLIEKGATYKQMSAETGISTSDTANYIRCARRLGLHPRAREVVPEAAPEVAHYEFLQVHKALAGARL